MYSKAFGASGNQSAYAVTVDREGNVYIAGATDSADFALVKPLQPRFGGGTDAFVMKLSSDGRVLFSTYLGGSDADVAYGIAVDNNGDIYVTGDTTSTDFPVVNAIQPKNAGDVDIFVAKLNSDGSKLIYSTYIGGSNGERGNAIAVDPAGYAYVAGYTNSTNFPTVSPLQSQFAGGNADAFVLKVSPSGDKLIYSTYLGGGNDRPDIATAIAVDSAGDAYITGFTNSRDFPTLNPLQPFRGPTDVFLSKINAAGSALIYSTHLGGSADDEAMAIAVDTSGNAYVTGHTESVDFPTNPGAIKTTCLSVEAHLQIGNICSGGDAFVSKISADGSKLVYSTYLNGIDFEVGRGIAIDPSGGAYVVGFTGSHDFPTVSPVQKFGGGAFDAFLTKLNADGSNLTYSTTLGGSDDDGAYAVAVASPGTAYVVGYTESADFPLRPRASRNSSGSRRLFAAKIGGKSYSK
jgi:hypothetical protein